MSLRFDAITDPDGNERGFLNSFHLFFAFTLWAMTLSLAKRVVLAKHQAFIGSRTEKTLLSIALGYW